MRQKPIAETSISDMDQPHIQGMNQVEWQPHPTIQGVLTKIFENRASHALADVLIARVVVAGEIPWHVHEAASETAYVLVGKGILKYVQDDRRTDTLEVPLSVGVALTMPPGWWHTVINTGSVSLELFAFHTPPIF